MSGLKELVSFYIKSVDVNIAPEYKINKIRVCPKCKVTLKTIKIKDNNISIDKCPDCNGIWLDNDEISKISESS